MFDRQGNFLSYSTEEALIAILNSDMLDPQLPHTVKQRTVVDAASHGWNDVLDLLFSMGYSPDDHDGKNYTPLGCAALGGQEATLVKLLDEYGCDPFAMNNAGPSYKAGGEWFAGYSALELAIDHNNYTCARALINRGLELDDETRDETEARIVALESERAQRNWQCIRNKNIGKLALCIQHWEHEANKPGGAASKPPNMAFIC